MFFVNTSFPPHPHLKDQPCIFLETLFSLSSLTLYSDDFLWGEEAWEYTPVFLTTHLLIWGADHLWVLFLLFVWRSLFCQSPSSHPPKVLNYPHIHPRCSQRALLISALLSWDPPLPPTLCTHQWPKCVQWSHRSHQKWCLHHECAHRDTCTRFCTLGLNLCMT